MWLDTTANPFALTTEYLKQYRIHQLNPKAFLGYVVGYDCKAFALTTEYLSIVFTLTTEYLKKQHHIHQLNPKAFFGYLVGYGYSCIVFTMTMEYLKKQYHIHQLNPKAFLGCLVGYDSTNVFRIFKAQTNKDILSRNVTFDEDEVFDRNIEALRNDLMPVSQEGLLKLLNQFDQTHTRSEEIQEVP
ncbi:hypothetical protein PABG_12517 [Paracoccidioides brasiliensis Pb03]|nr:hypothetical protein PABG_12517 [Paracoccidioides brasiliensis Pb03]